MAIPVTQTTGKNRVDTSLGESDSVAWKAVFKPHLFVRGFKYKDLSDNVVLSYDTTTVVSLVEKLYTKMAKSANGEMPHVSDIVDDPAWAHLVSTVHEMDGHSPIKKTSLVMIQPSLVIPRRVILPDFEILRNNSRSSSIIDSPTMIRWLRR